MLECIKHGGQLLSNIPCLGSYVCWDQTQVDSKSYQPWQLLVTTFCCCVQVKGPVQYSVFLSFGNPFFSEQCAELSGLDYVLVVRESTPTLVPGCFIEPERVLYSYVTRFS